MNGWTLAATGGLWENPLLLLALVAVWVIIFGNAVGVARRAHRKDLSPVKYFVQALLFPFWTDLETRVRRKRRKE